MQGIISRALCVLPYFLTGRLSGLASRQIQSAYFEKEVVKTYRYGLLARFLIWGGGRPILFSLLIGELLLGLSTLLGGYWLLPGQPIANPSLSSDFDSAAYIGVPWSIQVTLVALVYPLVISFVALMLQRKASSSIGLRAYLVDSGVVPAGASSIALALVLSSQYAMALYDFKEYVVPTIVFNWGWLTLNILLTGNFLGRTIRFLSDDEHQLSFKRLALNVVLWGEWLDSTKRQIFVETPARLWPNFSNEGNNPVVKCSSFDRLTNTVMQKVGGNQELQDVHIRLLRVVVWSWARRASKCMHRKQVKKPTLTFSPQVGNSYSSEVVLCGVSEGPALNAFETLLVRCAFVFRKSSANGRAPSTALMIRELAEDVGALVESAKYRQAKESFNRVLEFHRTLLTAVVEPWRVTLNDRSYQNHSISTDWLEPYLDLCQVAVRVFESERRLFHDLAHLPGRLAIVISPLDEVRIVESMRISVHLAYRLEVWWIKQAESFGLSKGRLPSLQNKDYQQAVIEFVGAWNSFHVVIPPNKKSTDAEHWRLLCGRARVYATHLEKLAELFLAAVSRGDATASEWFCDAYLKWWNTKSFELMSDSQGWERDQANRKATLSVTELPWSEVAAKLHDGKNLLTIENSVSVVGNAVRNYWEALRLLLVLQLLENLPANSTPDTLEIRLIVHLVTKRALRRGGQVEAMELSSQDAIWTALIATNFSDAEVTRRLDAFVDRLRWDKQIPEVPGWAYMWSGSPNELETKSMQMAQLLASAGDGTEAVTPKAKRLTESFWKDSVRLRELSMFFRRIRAVYVSTEYTSAKNIVNVLRQALGHAADATGPSDSANAQASALSNTALHERELTLQSYAIDQSLIQAIGHKVSLMAFMRSTPACAPFKRVALNSNLTTNICSVAVTGYPKELLIPGSDSNSDELWVKEFSSAVWTDAKRFAIWEFIGRTGLTIHNLEHLVKNDAPNEQEVNEKLRSIADSIAAVREAGDTPVVLVSGWSSFFDSPYGLREDLYGKSTPPDVRLDRCNDSDILGVYSQFNGAPIVDGDLDCFLCCVLPLRAFDVLYVGGADFALAVKAVHRPFDVERIALDFSFKVSVTSPVR
jgi:hypothetical protein